MEKIQSLLEEFKAESIMEVSDNEIKLRLTVNNVEDWNKWLENFSELSCTNWNVHKTFPNPVRYVFRKIYICCYNQFRHLEQSKSQKINTRCPAKMDVKIKLTTRRVQRRDKLTAVYPCIVTLSNPHNHSTDSADALSQLRLTSKDKNTLNKYFESGLSPGQVYRWLQLELMAGDVEAMGSNQLFQKPRALYYHWELSKKNAQSTYVGEEMLNAICEYAQCSDASVLVKTLSEGFVCTVVTPFMKRVHQLEQAKETVFVDTTSHIDQRSCAFTVLLCQSCLGPLPLGVIISSKMNEESYYEGFLLLLKELGKDAFAGESPSVFLTNDTSAQKKAIFKAWPDSIQLLSVFNVLQAVWRWLLSVKNKIPKENRQGCLKRFKDILHSVNEGQTERNYGELVDHCRKRDALNFLCYVDKLMVRKREWCLVDRLQLRTDSSHTKYNCELTIHVIKNIIFNRCEAYNPCQMVRLAVEVFSPYFQGRIMSIVLGKKTKSYPKQQLHRKDLITKLSDAEYSVKNATTSEHIYTVDIESGTCSCPYGMCGGLCRHQYSTIMHFVLSSNLYCIDSAEEKHKWASVALGADKAPHVPSFKGSAQGTSNSNGISITTQSSDNKTQDVAILNTNNVDDDPQHENVELTEQSHCGTSSPTVARNKKLLAELFCSFKQRIDLSLEDTTVALQSFNSRLCKIKTPQQMNSSLIAFSTSTTSSDDEEDIHTQPKPTAGRRIRSVSLRKRKPPSAIVGSRVKRKRNSTYKVNDNTDNSSSE